MTAGMEVALGVGQVAMLQEEGEVQDLSGLVFPGLQLRSKVAEEPEPAALVTLATATQLLKTCPCQMGPGMAGSRHKGPHSLGKLPASGATALCTLFRVQVVQRTRPTYARRTPLARLQTLLFLSAMPGLVLGRVCRRTRLSVTLDSGMFTLFQRTALSLKSFCGELVVVATS